MELDEKEQEVLNFFEEQSGRWVLMKKPTLSLDTRLGEDLRMVWEEADELAKTFFQKFNVDSNCFDILDYLGEDLSFITKLYYKVKGQPITETPNKPLTIRMFSESAKAGRWLY